MGIQNRLYGSIGKCEEWYEEYIFRNREIEGW